MARKNFKIGDLVYGMSDPFHVCVRDGLEEIVGISGSGAWKMYHTLRPGQDPQEARYGSRAMNLAHAEDVDVQRGIVRITR